ncbi:hypothetical protein QR680_015039 [Steinernema hermaphroditum]|uniref:UDP-glucuronosyltransferase n=1 Tax=Steinernema hermaphroditum TaxID=289476 RepID=A0AA39ICH4_9BILA|nr:hypothetical protein QR680_015039 [Steinernema hermaphroditum]
MNPALFLVLLFISAACSLKIVIFTPQQSNSQVILNKRVAEELAKAGHDVTLILIKNIQVEHPAVDIHPNITVWNIDAAPSTTRNIHSQLRDRTFNDIPVWDQRIWGSFHRMANLFVSSCEKTVQNKDFLKRLMDAKFDVAFAHMYDYCPIGLIHYAKIPTWIWLNSGVLSDIIAQDMGVESPSSYVPTVMIDASDEMTFVQRLKNQIGRFLFIQLNSRFVVDPQTEIFRKHIDPSFPDLRSLGKQCPLVMVNSNELYDLPRPILHKVVYIGGLGMKQIDGKPLEGEFKEAIEKANKVVIMTFGSVARAHDMPESWKSAFVNAFRQFPNVQFIIRYGADDLKERVSKNVLFSKWIPQSDLLQHPKTAAFISHGGYNSLQEAITAGKPIITIPLFGDQPRNARIASKHGLGYLITKPEVTEENVVKALKALLTEEKYTVAAKRLKQMIDRRPIPSEVLLTRWTEFLAEFKQLDNLFPYGTKLSFIQYNNLDVIFVIVSVIFILVVVCYKVLQSLYRLVRWISTRSPKVKTS